MKAEGCSPLGVLSYVCLSLPRGSVRRQGAPFCKLGWPQLHPEDVDRRRQGGIMRVRNSIVLRSGLLAFLLILTAHASLGAPSSKLVVSNTAACPHAHYTKIQDAINAASAGDEIVVCNGIYAEQLSITKSLDIEADSGAFLVPAPIQQNATSLAT